MKPPWRYLSQLMSRKKTSDTPDDRRSVGTAGNLEIESKPAETVLLPSPEGLPETEPSDVRAGDDHGPMGADVETDAAALDLQLDESEGAKAEATREQKQSDPDPQDPPSAETAVQSLKTRAKATRKDRSVATPAPTGTETPAPRISSPTDTFSNDATDLDRDIQQLRDLLAQKLRLQNAQLRAMLERFDRF